MCDFCKDEQRWNTDDYALVPNRSLTQGLMIAEDGIYQIGTFDSQCDYWDVLEIAFCPMCGMKLVEE